MLLRDGKPSTMSSSDAQLTALLTSTTIDDAIPPPLPAVTTSDLLDDIFSSSPPHSSSATTSSDQTHPSDLPRLHQHHFNPGYLDGLTFSKTPALQPGFDEGYPLGAHLGLLVGYVLGVLQGLGDRKLLAKAKEELGKDGIFAKEWWGEDGVWAWEGGEDEEGFKAVARAHPLVSRWINIVEEQAERNRIDLGRLEREMGNEEYERGTGRDQEGE
jgi:hypothetical protein